MGLAASDPEADRHLALIAQDNTIGAKSGDQARFEEMRTTPLFSAEVRAKIRQISKENGSTVDYAEEILPQYALLGMRSTTYGSGGSQDNSDDPKGNLIYANVNAPWSTFICGSQGSGKSHTLSCMLENSLLYPSKTGAVAAPLTGLVLHYDKFTGVETGQLCEAAYLCSSGIPVNILVSPSNYAHMKKLYSDLPGLPASAPKPNVYPMLFREEHLNIGMMKNLMAVGGGGKPLYMEVVTMILREMAGQAGVKRGFDIGQFKARLQQEELVRGQNPPLQMRLRLLESFLETKNSSVILERKGIGRNTINNFQSLWSWDFTPGSLTIVDLSCPFVDENEACSLFNICLGIFLEDRSQAGRIVALDEAHKFMTDSREAMILTGTLLSIIRQQRHLGTRVIIATQEPTLSPNLLDLCNVSIVHRFSSPEWFKTLQGHLAGAVVGTSDSARAKYSPGGLFAKIVSLRTGEALVFCPSGILDTGSSEDDSQTDIEDMGAPKQAGKAYSVKTHISFMNLDDSEESSEEGSEESSGDKEEAMGNGVLEQNGVKSSGGAENGGKGNSETSKGGKEFSELGARYFKMQVRMRPVVLEERNGEIEFRVVSNDGTPESWIILTGLKCLFQKQLPKMPKDYIARLVYDRTHLSIAIVKMPLEVIGGISFREFRDLKFAEIVFCAV
ncbi:hypothetical protein AJ80_05953 [Polytolypa hystricis UAMH7299]|uniref:AAA+ ATPase domain-containing protein n=1 Tax=Polytolypa hystricis (strain UAMH7299) TaxID=1447883 RepID=A0A2B7Y013_POLH7|nr:hypothetical protein AJ80_05953 [Polytolypa hystricis UAMH7299]